MFKTLALIAAGVLTVATPSQVQAQTFSPTNSTSTLNGYLIVDDGTLAADCDVTIEMSIDGAGAAHVTARTISPGNWLYCGLLVQPVGTWAIAPGSASGTVDLTLEISTPFATCSGTVPNVPYAFTRLVLNSETLSSSSGPDCIIDGVLYATPPFSV